MQPMRWLAMLLALSGCAPLSTTTDPPSLPAGPSVVVLGIAQDAGYPHAGCRRSCCELAWRRPELRRKVSSLAIVDPGSGERWIVDATPDLTAQLRAVHELDTPARVFPPESPIAEQLGLTGILLTHAHVGHYTGLMLLGREGVGSRKVPVWVMPRMRTFLESHEPWRQLVALGQIDLRGLEPGRALRLNERIAVTPLLVPHRDEHSETVGYVIEGPSRSVAFIPDIDKWERWDLRIEDLLARVDLAYLDGTFFADGEVPGRSMSEIPHPFIEETMARLSELPETERAKVRFIHLNHTNPALVPGSAAEREVERRGFAVAREGERIGL